MPYRSRKPGAARSGSTPTSSAREGACARRTSSIANRVTLTGEFDSHTLRVLVERWDISLVTMLTEAALRPYIEARPGWLRDPGFCPLRCGFQLDLDWDNHFFLCLKERALGVWFTPR